MEFNATFLVTIISFLLFMEIMNIIFYAHLKKIGAQRETLISQNYKEAQDIDNQSQEIIDNRDKKFDEAMQAANKKMNEKINEANFNYQKEMSETRDKAFRKMVEIKKELVETEKDVTQALDSEIDNISGSIVSKILEGGNNG